MAKEDIDVNDFSALHRIFSKLKWHQNLEQESVFDEFCMLLSNLNREQNALILDLTSRYLWVPSSDYEKLLLKVLNKIESDKIINCKKIYLLPIVRPGDDGKIKSASFLLYLFKSLAFIHYPKFKEIDLELVETLKDVQDNSIKVKEGELIFMIDDYLGSGETIKAAISYILTNRDIDQRSLNIISLVAQADAINYLEEFNFSYYVHIIRNKGISEYYNSPQKEKCIEIMKSIENLIPGNHFSFGYNGSEALVTMIRTPDNTFPIFWKTYKSNNTEFNSPFARYK